VNEEIADFDLADRLGGVGERDCGGRGGRGLGLLAGWLGGWWKRGS